MVSSVSSVRTGQRAQPASGSGASRAARSARLRTNSGRAPGRPARANHSDASGAGVMAMRVVAPVVAASLLLQARAQRARTAEQPQAAAHFEQHGVGRLEADARREMQAAPREGFEQLPLAAQVARQRVQRRDERERTVDRHAVAHPGGLHGRIAGAHDLAVAVEVDDRDGRLPGQRLHGFAQRIEQQRGQVQREPEFARAGLREWRAVWNGECRTESRCDPAPGKRGHLSAPGSPWQDGLPGS